MKYTSLLRKSLLIAILTISMQSFSQTIPAIGTIPPGDSVVIYYDVTINNPLPPGTVQISNQGSVSGSNFSTLVTDDPDTQTPSDATITVVNIIILPVMLIDFRAYNKGAVVELQWKVAMEVNLQRYEVERSNDGRGFTAIGNLPARGLADYIFNDAQPFAGTNFYRLKMIDNDGKIKYSGVLKVNLANKAASISCYPNPVHNKVFNLQLSNIEKGSYYLQLYNTKGQMVMSRLINHTGGSVTQSIYLPVAIKNGLYRLQVRNEKVVYNQSLVVQ